MPLASIRLIASFPEYPKTFQVIIKPNRILTCPSACMSVIISGAEADELGVLVKNTSYIRKRLEVGICILRDIPEFVVVDLLGF